MNFNHRRGRVSLSCQGARSVAAAALGLAPGCPHQNDGGGVLSPPAWSSVPAVGKGLCSARQWLLPTATPASSENHQASCGGWYFLVCLGSTWYPWATSSGPSMGTTSILQCLHGYCGQGHCDVTQSREETYPSDPDGPSQAAGQGTGPLLHMDHQNQGTTI